MSTRSGGQLRLSDQIISQLRAAREPLLERAFKVTGVELMEEQDELDR